MRLSTLRALFLALAMVFQTLAGGIGVARAMPTELALAAHCAAAGKSDVAVDHRQEGGHRRCGSCCLCAGPSGLSLVAFVVVSVAPPPCRTARFTPGESVAIPARLAEAHRARGPPGADRA